MTTSRILTEDEAFAPVIPPITIELTSRCNFKCPYCANPTLKRAYGEMSDELVFRLADECASNGHKVMAVHGIGEPLLRKDLETVLARFSALGIWQGWISTNGALLSVQRMTSLVQAGLRGVYISMDTLDTDIYRRTRGGKLSKTISNVQKAANAFPDVPLVVGLMNHREQVVEAQELDLFYSIFSEYPNVYHHTYENMRFPQAAEDWRRNDPATGRRFEFDDCDQWAYHFTIAIDGRVSVCCVDQEVEHLIGDVTRESIKDIWLRESTQNTLRSISLGLHDCPTVCTNCVLKHSKRRLSDIDPILSGPYSSLAAAATAAQADGHTDRAIELLKHMKKRNPWDQSIQSAMNALGALPEPSLIASSEAERKARLEPAVL